MVCGGEAGSGKVHPALVCLSPSPGRLCSVPRKSRLLPEPACAAKLPGSGAAAAIDSARTPIFFYGAEGYSDSIHSTNLGDHTRGRAAAYAALDVRALRRFSFNLGAREEVYRSVQGQFSPSVSAGYWLNSHFKFRGNVSHAFRVPSLTDLYYHDPTSVGNPNSAAGARLGFRNRARLARAAPSPGRDHAVRFARAGCDRLYAHLSDSGLAGDQHRPASISRR